ncbi:hypothetical protein FB451DRAFT_251182 [Mycena latifolia]|nr:hypothetical protein FB451DRAFT_251182 [Mycena latifolia]
MERSSSPFRLSPGSSCSSTLIMTPASLPLLRGPAPKGPLQPHITNLPRRRRAPMPTLRISAPPPPSASSRATDSAYAPSPIQLPSLPPLPFPISAGGVPMQRETVGVLFPSPRGPVQPAHGNVPRRAKPLSAAQARTRRRRERCIQELGRTSGVFIAFDCDPAEETDKEEGFDALVRISPARDGKEDEGKDAGVHDKGGGAAVLRIVVPGTRDDGVPCLQPAQLRAACTFVWQQKAEGRRVMITAPRAHAVDALSVGVYCVSRGVEAGHSPVEYADNDEDDAERVHRLVMRWHDLPADDDEEDADNYGGDGLKEEWRGLLSRDGMDYLAAAVGCSPPASPPSSP